MPVRGSKPRLYAAFMGYKCANPDCNGGNIEVHHILPKKAGGCDEYWNFICLCSKCHRTSGFHSKHKNNDVELFTWKSLQELELWGFTLDEQDPQYYDNLKKLILAHRTSGDR